MAKPLLKDNDRKRSARLTKRSHGPTSLEKARHAAEYERASAAWDTVKSNPSAKGHDVAWRAFQDAKLPADHTQARAELDRAIKAADAAYHEEVGR
jgi:hypothetical protein